MKKIMFLAVCTVFLTALTGCETMKGFAKDLQNTGDNIWEVVAK